jgi:hypothetical protein
MQRDLQRDDRTFTVSQLCAAYRGEEDFFSRFRALALQFEGVDDVIILAAGQTRVKTEGGKFFATEPVRCMKEVVGELVVYIQIDAFRNSSPMPVTKFLARQLEIAVQSAAIHASNLALQQHLAGLEAEVSERKLLERARGVIESRRLIPAGEGERLLKKLSDQSGRNLKDVAQGIVATANKNPWRFRREFWA